MTTAAGALADQPRSAGAARDSTPAAPSPKRLPSFCALDDLVVTGPTGSNLMDLYLGLVG
jgi:glycerate-2-kinase